MALRLVHATEGEYSLPESLVFGENSYRTKVSQYDLSFADGARSSGEEIQDRKVTIEGKLGCATREAYRTLADEIRYWASLPELKLYIDAGDYFLNLARLLDFVDDPEPLWDRSLSRLKLHFQADDPFWYAAETEVQSFSPTGNQTLTVDATAARKCFRGQHPVIKVTAPAFATLNTFTLRNTTDGGIQFRYSDPLLKNTKYVEIDCVNGTCRRSDGTNTIQYFSGEWLRLLNAENAIAYEGAAATVRFEWRPRWL